MFLSPGSRARPNQAAITRRNLNKLGVTSQIAPLTSAAVFNVATYGAVPDYHEASTISVAGAGSAVTATGSPFNGGMAGSLINITGAGAAGATYFGTILSVQNANAITVTPALSTAQTNVFAQWGKDQTTAIQATINAARTAGGGTIVVPTTGTYCIQQLDFTNSSPLTLKGAANVNGSRFMPMRSTNSVMDWTGTSSINIDGISVGQFNQLAVPSYGLVISPSNPNNGIDFNNLRNIFWTGNYLLAALYLDRCASSSCRKCSFLNYYQGSADTGFTAIFTHNNIFGFSSAFATTFSGAESMSDWSFVGCEFHAIIQAGGVGAFSALYLDNCTNISFFGGNMATSHAGIINIATGTVSNILFMDVTFYADTGTSPVNLFVGVGNLSGIGVYNTGINYTGAIANTSGTISNLVQNGNIGGFLTSTSSATALTSGTPAALTSVSLTPGDWDVTGQIQYTGNAATTVLRTETSVSQNSSLSGTKASFYGANSTYFGTVNGAGFGVAAPLTRFSLTSTTTVYLISEQSFGTNTMSATGTIRAQVR